MHQCFDTGQLRGQPVKIRALYNYQIFTFLGLRLIWSNSSLSIPATPRSFPILLLRFALPGNVTLCLLSDASSSIYTSRSNSIPRACEVKPILQQNAIQITSLYLLTYQCLAEPLLLFEYTIELPKPLFSSGLSPYHASHCKNPD